MLCALCGSLSQQFREEDAEVWGAGGAGGTAFFRREANVAHHRLQELKKAARKEQEAAAKSIPEQVWPRALGCPVVLGIVWLLGPGSESLLTTESL